MKQRPRIYYTESQKAHLLSLTAQSLSKAQRAGEVMEVDCDAQDEVEHS